MKKEDKNLLRFAIVMAAFIVFVVLTVKMVVNISAYGNPPFQCQLLGGHWSIWSGWSCN